MRKSLHFTLARLPSCARDRGQYICRSCWVLMHVRVDPSCTWDYIMPSPALYKHCTGTCKLARGAFQ